jgi:hypothetical protein
MEAIVKVFVDQNYRCVNHALICLSASGTAMTTLVDKQPVAPENSHLKT